MMRTILVIDDSRDAARAVRELSSRLLRKRPASSGKVVKRIDHPIVGEVLIKKAQEKGATPDQEIPRPSQPPIKEADE